MVKARISDNFSRFASFYDKYADIQMKAAAELIAIVKGSDFGSIFEIGCGTGNYTLILRENFKRAKLKAVDISGEMINVAKDKLKDKNVDFIIADAEDIKLNAKFDLITSNACFQWFSHLDLALKTYKRMLNEGGMVLFSTFGPLTFNELNASLPSVKIDSSAFINKEGLETILRDGFQSIKINESRYTESFRNLWPLLEKIKYSGIGGSGPLRRLYIGKGFLRDLEERYVNRYGRIEATYQVFFCEGSI